MAEDKWYRLKAYQYVDDYVMEACRNEGSAHFKAAVANVEKLLRKAGDRGASTQWNAALDAVLALPGIACRSDMTSHDIEALRR